MKKQDLHASRNHRSSLSNKSSALAILPNQNIFKNNLSNSRKDSQLSNISTRIKYGISKSHNTTSMQRFKTQNSKIQKSGQSKQNRIKTQSTEQFFLGSPFRGSPKIEKTKMTTDVKTHNESNLYLDHDAIDFVEKVEAEKDKGKTEEVEEGLEVRQSKQSQVNIRQSSKKADSEMVNSQEDEEDEEQQSKISKSKIRKDSSRNIKESGSSEMYYNYSENTDAYQFGDFQSNIGESIKGSFKPIIRSFSHSQKVQIISNNKYAPKTDEEKRMEQRYIKSQQKLVEGVKETKQLDYLLSQYERNKKFMVQQSMRKHQIKRVLQSKKLATVPHQQKDQLISKAVSLPRLKPAYQVQLPCPESFKLAKSKQQLVIQKRLDEKIKSLSSSLSANRFEYEGKKQKLLKTKAGSHSPSQNEQLDNIESIERLFNKKGIDYHPTTLRKGLMSVRIKTQQVGIQKVEMPKKLFSNPIYKKYPL